MILKVLTNQLKNKVTYVKSMHSMLHRQRGAPVYVAGKIKVGYRADIINTDHMEANNRIGCTRLQKTSVTGMKIKTLQK